jgi:hypothetical protein
MPIDKSLLRAAVITEDITDKELAAVEEESFKYTFGKPPHGKYFVVLSQYTQDLWFYIRKLSANAREFYLVANPEVVKKYRTRLTPHRCALAIDEDGLIYVWPVNLQVQNNAWCESALECIGFASEEPIELSSTGLEYQANRASPDFEFPEVFPPKLELGIVEAVAEALGDKHIISSLDHPQLARLGTPIRVNRTRKEDE